MKQYTPQRYSIQEAKELGYESITLPFSNTPEDQEMMSKVLADMANVDHCIIETAHGPEVGRPKTHLL